MAFNSFFANPPANSSNATPNTGGIFGLSQNTNTNQSNTTTPSLFGNSNPAPNPQTLQPPTQPSLFGNTNNTNTGTNANSNQNATTNTGGSLFGQQPQQPSTSGGTTTQGAPLFGNTGGSLFGQQQQPQQPSTSGGTTTQGASLFGNTGGSLFGQQQQPQQPQQPSTSGGTTTQGASLFGNTGGSLFGQQQQPQQPSTSGGTTQGASLFGNTGGSLFGQQPQQPSTSGGTTTQGASLFGNTGMNAGGTNPTNTNTGSLFGQQSTTGGLTGQQGTTVTQVEAQEQFLKISQGVETIYQAWNPATKNCRFQYIFYNLVDPKQVSMYGRPPNATNDALWEKAVRENPDPTCLVPVIAIGFDDLRERANAQSSQSSSHLQKLTDLSTRLKSLLTEHSISNASRLQRAHNSQTQLIQRLMRLVQHLHLLIPAVRSSSIRVEEEELRGKLEEMEEELKRSRVKGKLNEMWALLGAVGAFMERGRGDGQGGQGEWAVVDDEGLAQITQILAEQQAGLQHLTKILQKDQKDLAIIMGSGTAGGDDGYLANEVENMWGSTNASLRSSRLR